MDKSTVYWVIILLALVLFSGFINEITGKAGATFTAGCTDSDGGLNVKVWGSVSSKTMKGIDTCVNEQTVNEGYCKRVMYGFTPASQQIACPIGTYCKDGACIPRCKDTTWRPDGSTVCSGTSFSQTSNCGTTRQSTGTKYCPPPCIDSEEGKNYAIPGTVEITYGMRKYLYPDCCTAAAGGPCTTTGPVLNETYCGVPSWATYETPMSERYTCPNGCENGACIPSISTGVTETLGTITKP